jgi:hypothetical protein
MALVGLRGEHRARIKDGAKEKEESHRELGKAHPTAIALSVLTVEQGEKLYHPGVIPL